MPLKLPLLPLRLLKIRNYSVAVIVGTVGQMVYYALNVLWPQQITALYTTNNALIGWMSVSLYFLILFLSHVDLTMLVHNRRFIGTWRDRCRRRIQMGWSFPIATRSRNHRLNCFLWHDGFHNSTHRSSSHHRE
jgi:hypothetical protein